MTLLVVDASTYTGTVAVVRDGRVIAARETAMRGRDAERLMPAVAECLEAAGVAPEHLDGVICGAGPGSFTSLRIAASIAKGIAYGARLPLHAVSSLLLMVGGLDPLPAPGRYLVVLDALRGEVYAQLVEVTGAGVRALDAPRLEAEGDVEALAASLDARPVGSGRSIDAVPHARGAARLLPDPLGGARAVDLGSWEPDYGRLAEAQVRWEAAHGRPLAQG